MDIKLKQRLVGAVVLICLTIIFLPLLFDGTEEERARIAVDIPQSPRIELKGISVQDIQDHMSEMEASSEAALPQEFLDTTDYREAGDFVFDYNGLPVEWSLQLGSFKREENATGLRTRLREANYRSYVLRGSVDESDVWRVFVGPSSSRKALLDMNIEIAKKLNLKEGHLVRYRVEEDTKQLGG